jgi:hypothetical protein
LNLAKAELLLFNPSAVTTTKLHHGAACTFSPGSTLAGHEVTCHKSGVFPLLYEKRIGTPLTSHTTRLSVKRLLSIVPEVGAELVDLDFIKPAAIPAYAAFVLDANECWPLLCLPDSTFFKNKGDSLTKLLLRHFDEVSEGELGWRKVFAVSTRALPQSVTILQGKRAYPRSQWKQLQTDVRTALMNHIDASQDALIDVLLFPKLYSNRKTVITPSLARYLILFYLSNLVRYKPSMLDRRSHPEQAWLMDAFADQVAINVLAGFLDGISGMEHRFNSTMRL